MWMMHRHQLEVHGGSMAKFIGVGTILTVIDWLRKYRKTKSDDRIIDTFAVRDGRWRLQSAIGVVSRMKREGVHRFARVALQPSVTDWKSFRAFVRLLPERIAYFYCRTFIVPSRNQAERALRDLWKRGLIVAAPDNPQLYQLRN
jgi:hypothetical protein